MPIDLQQSISYLKSCVDGDIEALDGGIRICHIPHVARLAYLHKLYPPIATSELTNLQAKMPTKIPDSFAQFLKLSNGARLFGSVLSINGYCHTVSRSIEGLGQPISLDYSNLFERSGAMSDGDFGIGNLVGHDTSLDLVMTPDGVIKAINDKAETLKLWANFEIFWGSELVRLSSFFDRAGRVKVNENELLNFENH